MAGPLRSPFWVVAPELGLEMSPQTREFMEGGDPPLCHAVRIWGAEAVTGHLSLQENR